jgi:hypothetical protein
MRVQGAARVVRWTGVLVFTVVAGCHPAQENVVARRMVDVPQGAIRRIAVLPFTEGEAVRAATQLPGQEPLPEPPGDTVTRAMIDAMRRYPDWQIVDSLIVQEAFRRLYDEVRAPTPDEARAVGRLLGVDAVVRGEVTDFEERIGTEIAAQRPAKVVFAVELIQIPSGTIAWQAEYAERQQALSDNLFNLPWFVRAGAKWVRASELVALGAEQVAAPMHGALFGGDTTPPRRRHRSR